MRIKTQKITLDIDEPIEDYTKTFLIHIVNLLEKGINNPAFQLHCLSLLYTGKNFIELITGEDMTEFLSPEIMMNILAKVPKDIMEQINKDVLGATNLSNTTIDDILGGKE